MINNAIKEIKDIRELNDKMSRLIQLKEKALKELQRLYNCDIFISPCFPLIAPPLSDYYHKIIPAYVYAIYWSVLDLPSGVIA